MAWTMVSSSRSGDSVWVGDLISFRISPCGVTTAAAIFVPPTSTPTAFILYLLIPAVPPVRGRLETAYADGAPPSPHARLLQAALGERVQGDIVQAGDHEVRPGVRQKLLVIGPREAQGLHVARLRGL